jgi:hypothetical protein
MKKTGKNSISGFLNLFSVLSLVCLTLATQSFATIQAAVDRSEVPQDESISLKITHTGGSDSLSPKFDAPDFEIMNQFESSQFSSVYVNGKFENRSEQSITYILRPLKVGTLRIRNITNNAEKAPDVSVQVIQDNAYKKSVGADAPKLNEDTKNFFVKAEVSKSRAYRGEQIVVSYYIYRRTRVNIRDVMQYPSFNGFIREDLEMPILAGRPDYEAVSLGGIPFERALLARYALYPIKEGKLKIEGFSIRADYIPKNSGSDDLLQDPFFQFFTQVTPRTGTSKSDPVTIDVLPLPEEGKSSLFTGGVGNFEVSSQLDSTTLKANSPVNLRVTVRGKGNASLIEFPQVAWPQEVKFYESQGKSKNLGQGTTEKTFEVVLVPLQKGEFDLPPIEFEFFNPESRGYTKKKTAPIHLSVAEGDPGSAQQVTLDPNLNKSDSNSASVDTKDTFGSLRKGDPKRDPTSSFLGQPWWKWVAWFGLLVFFSFVALVLFDLAKKRSKIQLDLLKRKQNIDTLWSKLQRETNQLVAASAHADQFSEILEQVVEQLYVSLDDAFGLTSRAMPQRDLAKALTDAPARISPEQWAKISEIFDFSEMIRFASSTGVVADSETHQKVHRLVDDARKICAEIASKKLES